MSSTPTPISWTDSTYCPPPTPVPPPLEPPRPSTSSPLPPGTSSVPPLPHLPTCPALLAQRAPLQTIALRAASAKRSFSGASASPSGPSEGSSSRRSSGLEAMKTTRRGGRSRPREGQTTTRVFTLRIRAQSISSEPLPAEDPPRGAGRVELGYQRAEAVWVGQQRQQQHRRQQRPSAGDRAAGSERQGCLPPQLQRRPLLQLCGAPRGGRADVEDGKDTFFGFLTPDSPTLVVTNVIDLCISWFTQFWRL